MEPFVLPTLGGNSGFRVVAAVLLAMALGSFTNSAKAAGCHAADRPAAGLRFTRDTLEPLAGMTRADQPASPARASRVVAPPCSDPTPATTTADVSTPSALGSTAGTMAADPSRRLERADSPLTRVFRFTSRLERPPRS